jgi:RND family efflux transporter MFP subunit
MAATPAAPSASSVPASVPAPVATAQPSAPVATIPGVAAAESQAAAAVATDGPRAAPSPDTVQVRGVIKPKEEVLFSSKIAARIATMPFKEGARFKKGALLVGFDCSRLRAEANAAWAANRASKEIQKQSVALDSYNAIGKSEVQIAHAKAAQTGAEAEAIEAQIKDCTISAPFSGVVVENMAHQYENVGPGKDLTKVLNDDELEVHLVAPSSWLSWLQVGSTFRFKVDETGRTLGGKIIRLGASVDPVSQTVRVVGTFSPHNDVVLPGMSGSADFPQVQRAPKS